MKKLCVAFALVLCICGCSVESKVGASYGAKWLQQLESVRAARTRLRDVETLTLVSYKYRGAISSESELVCAVEEVFSDGSLIGFGSVQDLYVTTMKEVKRPSSPDDDAVVIDDMLRKATGVVDLVWMYGGREYRTVALVSDDDGVIFDGFLSTVSSPLRPSTKSAGIR